MGKFLTIVPAVILLIIILVFSSVSSSEGTGNITNTGVHYTVSDIRLPDHIDFAGENVPLNLFDVKEALEREMLVNSYWHSQTLLLIKRAKRYFSDIEPVLKKNNIPDDFKYLALAESGLTNVTSPAGAVGFWQFVPATAKDYGLEINNEIDERYNVEKSTEAACKFIRESYNLYKNWTMAAASYNCGRKGLSKQIERQYTDNYYDLLLNEETARYIFRILSLKLILNQPENYGFIINDTDAYEPVPYTTVSVSTPVKDWALFAFNQGTNYKILKFLNPWLRESYLTNKEGKTYTVRIPAKGFRPHAPELSHTEIDSLVNESNALPQ